MVKPPCKEDRSRNLKTTDLPIWITQRSTMLAVGILLASLICIAAGSCIVVLGNRSPRLEIVERDQSLITDDNTPVESTFVLKNRGRAPLVVHDVISNQQCCGKTLEKPQEIPPGGEATVRVQVEPAREGRREFPFTVRTNDPRQAETVLKVTTVPSREPPYFNIEPGLIQLLNVWKPGLCRELLIETIEKSGDDPWLETVACDSEIVVVESAGPPTIRSRFDDNVLRSYRFSVILRELPPPGTLQSNLTIKTRNSEKIAKLSIQIVSPVKLAPTVLFVTDDDAERTVELIARDSGAQVVARISSRPDWVEISEDDNERPGVQRFLVRVPNAPALGSADGLLVFETETPAAGKLELRVCVRPQDKSTQ